jgi:glycine/D-amino acid oxidase-like deaminating enzyme
VLERGYLGSGQCRPQHHRHPLQLPAAENIRFYEHSMKLWEDLSHELNYNVMFSQRGVLNLAIRRRSSTTLPGAATPCGISALDAELMTREPSASD